MQFRYVYEDPENPIRVYFLPDEMAMINDQTLFLDGTFTICKNLNSYVQIYIFSIKFQTDNRSCAYPVLFAFCVKTSAVYTKLFNLISALCPPFFPNIINMDCVAAMLTVVVNRYPGAMQLCIFHIHQFNSYLY